MKHLLTLTALLISSLAMGQFPALPYNPDENGDGLIGVSDLQSFLAAYNSEFSSAASSNGIAFILIGEEMTKAECMTACNALSGPWGLPTTSEVSENVYLVYEAVGIEPDESLNFWGVNTGYTDDYASTDDYVPHGVSLQDEIWVVPYSSGIDVQAATENNANERNCLCSVAERPKMEYMRIVQDGDTPTMNSMVNELLGDGWYIHTTDELWMHLWRWKD